MVLLALHVRLQAGTLPLRKVAGEFLRGPGEEEDVFGLELRGATPRGVARVGLHATADGGVLGAALCLGQVHCGGAGLGSARSSMGSATAARARQRECCHEHAQESDVPIVHIWRLRLVLIEVQYFARGNRGRAWRPAPGGASARWSWVALSDRSLPPTRIAVLIRPRGPRARDRQGSASPKPERFCALDPPSARGHRATDRQRSVLENQRMRSVQPTLARSVAPVSDTLDAPAHHPHHREPFASLRLRTDAAKRFRKVENATVLLWKLLLVAQKGLPQT